MKVIQLVTGQLGANTYILSMTERGEGVVVDPGGDGEKILGNINNQGIRLTHILLTHGHFDHIGAVAFLKEKTEAAVCIHAMDAEMLTCPEKNLSTFFGESCISVEPDYLLSDGEILMTGGMTFEVIHTPGHSPGSVCFKTDKRIFTGDTLFHSSIGRTDVPGGNYQQILESIEKKLLILKEDYTIHPGHGFSTTLLEERSNNPFIQNKGDEKS